MVMPDKRIYVDQPADPDLIALLQADDPSFQKVGSDRIAGFACTAYVAVINGHYGRVCLTDAANVGDGRAACGALDVLGLILAAVHVPGSAATSGADQRRPRVRRSLRLNQGAVTV